MSTIPQDSIFGRIGSLIQELNGQTKTASANGTTKKGTDLGLTGQGKKDPGGYEGPSTHPSAMEASNVQKTPLGSRAKENEKDVKEDHPGAGVDNTSGKGGTQDDRQFDVGITSKSTGEDPKVEDDYRLGKKDDKRQGDRGGTEGPFNAEEIKSSSFEKLTKTAYAKMNEILADLANGQSTNAQASGARPAGIAQPAGSTAPTEQEKLAAAQAIVEQTIIDARINADLVGEYLTKYAAHYEQLLRKAAADDGMGGGAMPPEGGEGGGAPPGGEAPPPEAGGAPPEGGQGGGPEAQLDELISALLSMGHTPEEIQQALQGLAGGGEGGAGGPPPEAGGAPPGGAPPEMAGGAPPGPEMGKMGNVRLSADQYALLKIAAAANQRWRSGQWKPVDVRPGTKEAKERNELQNYILEICNAR